MIDLNTREHACVFPFIPCEDGEIWKELTDKEAKAVKPYYMISNHGRVFNIYTGKIMKPSIDSKGYWFYNLRAYRETGCRMYRAHRLLMLAFHYQEGCENMEIDHIDTNKLNMSEDNLRWCTHGENGLYSYQNGHANPKGEDRPSATITNAQAKIICERLDKGDRVYIIAREMGISEGIVRSIKEHRAWNHISKDFNF